MTKIFVVGKDNMVSSMFCDHGYVVVAAPELADIICFTGGADISPSLYGEENTDSFCDPDRDVVETRVFNENIETFKVGICRGGQLLNVLSGGKMVQHIDGHTSTLRKVRVSGEEYSLAEDHHQGIVPSKDAEVIGVDTQDGNIEIVLYPHTRSLCFQAHPEWEFKGGVTPSLFFNLLESSYHESLSRQSA